MLKVLKATQTVGGASQTFYFLGRDDVYQGGVSTATGVSEAEEDEQNRPTTKVEELLGAGVLIRLAATIGESGADDNAQVRLLCTRAQLGTALDTLNGETIRSREIISVRVPRKASFF